MSGDPDRPPPAADIQVAVEDEGWALDAPAVAERAAEFAAAALAAAGRSGTPVEVAIVLTDDASVRRLNRDFRNTDRATNVLSFALADGEGPPAAPGQPVMLGDVFLARETVLAEAAAQGLAPSDHALHLVVHGVLHLVGYDHGTESDAFTMERLEARTLSAFGIADPYREEEKTGPA